MFEWLWRLLRIIFYPIIYLFWLIYRILAAIWNFFASIFYAIGRLFYWIGSFFKGIGHFFQMIGNFFWWIGYYIWQFLLVLRHVIFWGLVIAAIACAVYLLYQLWLKYQTSRVYPNYQQGGLIRGVMPPQQFGQPIQQVTTTQVTQVVQPPVEVVTESFMPAKPALFRPGSAPGEFIPVNAY